MPLALFPSLRLRWKAWEVRENVTAADAMFVGLAEELGEPFVTKDRGLAEAVRRRAITEVIELVV